MDEMEKAFGEHLRREMEKALLLGDYTPDSMETTTSTSMNQESATVTFEVLEQAVEHLRKIRVMEARQGLIDAFWGPSRADLNHRFGKLEHTLLATYEERDQAITFIEHLEEIGFQPVGDSVRHFRNEKIGICALCFEQEIRILNCIVAPRGEG